MRFQEARRTGNSAGVPPNANGRGKANRLGEGGIIPAEIDDYDRAAQFGHHPGCGTTDFAQSEESSLCEEYLTFFSDCADRFGELLRKPLEERTVRVDNHTRQQLRELSGALGSAGAGPRDVIELFETDIGAQDSAPWSNKGETAIKEGRMLLLELMGNLVSFYRFQARSKEADIP